ncbi:PA2778 family cysteine peptidase [Thiohalorhabdus denitrificans]|uniref:TPR repeat-containing protein n=1 Tax=Thiohalorhabdus denitrificans TaxID=381306 RepID=A0A1G5H9D3_9GAMM|nr:PA2778 family cysteine peptidase [Thiohalorhabdus denitrificans]SCY60396.1 TPR repeat-containing protein [Thiohalorhabdus denitrificans]
MWRVGGILAVLLLSACAHLESDRLQEEAGTLPDRARVAEVPFYPQEAHYCGPASLAMVLSWSGREVGQREVAPEVFTPDRDGSFRTDILAAARRHGRLAIPVKDLEGVLAEVAAGHPVLVFQNLGLDWLPRWHYAVVVGYDLGSGRMVLHTGRREAREVALSTFERTWERGGRWALVVLPPGEMAATAEPLAVLEAGVGLERADRHAAAGRVYAAVTRRWPDRVEGWIGLGNVRYHQGELEGAESAYREALRLEPRKAEAWNNLALVLGRSGRTRAAREAARSAIRSAGGKGEAYRETLQELGGTPEKFQ